MPEENRKYPSSKRRRKSQPAEEAEGFTGRMENNLDKIFFAQVTGSGRGRSHGPHKFYIPVVPRRHSFDERIFASSTAKSNNKESSLTRESIGKEAELEMKLAIVSNALMKEGEERQRIESDLKRSQKENKRLQEDLRTASGQLRKFTEWFFHSVELNTT